MKVKSESEVTQSCPTLSDPMDCSLPGSSIHGIFRARVLEWGAIAFSENMLSLLQTPLSFALSKTLPTVVLIFKDMTFLRSFLVLSPKYISLGTIVWFCSVSFSFWCMRAKSLQSLPTLCNTMDCSLPGSSVLCRHKRHRFDPWVRKNPWRIAWQPTPVFLPGESHGQWSKEIVS